MGRFGKAIFILWLLWVHLFFYRNLLARYAVGFGEVGLGGVAQSVLSITNKLLSLTGMA